MRLRAASFFVVRSKLCIEERLAEPWLQAAHFPTCAASSKQSGGIIGKIRSTRFEETSDITTRPPTLQQTSQKVSGDISRKTARSRQFRERRSMMARTIMSTLHGANLWSRCG